MNQTVSIGDRLREERLRLGMSQAVIGEVGGVTKKTQMLYEGGERYPDAHYMAAIAAAGADVLYILTGAREHVPPPTLAPDERVVIDGYRLLDARGKAGVMALIGGMSPSPGAGAGAGPKQVFHGDVGQVIKAQRPFKTTTTINVGKPGKPKK